MTITRMLLVEGASEASYLDALDFRINEVSARRRVYSEAAHELSHRLLTVNAANNSGMVAMLDVAAFLVFKQYRRAYGLDRFPSDDVLKLIMPLAGQSSGPRLPTWCTSDFVGMPPGTWLPRTSAIEALAAHAHIAEPRISFRLSDRTGSLLAAGQRVLMHMLEGLLAMVRLFDLQLRLLRHERSLIVARRGRGICAAAFVLRIIAVCRHYGHRSEPDDHAPLIIRRHLVPRGSCPQT
jgi:hypothetical protein